jgi:hypothetical protein
VTEDNDTKVIDELSQRRTSQHKTTVPGVINRNNRLPGVINTADEVPEEHVYLRCMAANGQTLLWEGDLLGDRSQDEGHGALPPQIQILCPFCSDKGVDFALLINPLNKPYEIERLRKPRYIECQGFQGPMRMPIWELLTVKEKLRCPNCNVQFEIKGGEITKVKS